MNFLFSTCKQVQPPVSYPGGMINRDQLFIPSSQWHKDKVVVVMGSTGTGKSRLSIDLATRFNAEIINSDKMQVYKGLNIVTNKVTEKECRGVPHHLLGIIDPDEDFTAENFAYHASLAADDIIERGRLPIIAGGSNSCIKALVVDDTQFRTRFDCCFLWVDVKMSVLHSFVSKRVDQMVEMGLVEEAKDFFDPKGDYTRGIRRAIGVPEMDDFFRFGDEELLNGAINEIKKNTCDLAHRQLRNILRLGEHLEWPTHRIDATEAFGKRGMEGNEAWEKFVAGPGSKIVSRFLAKDQITCVPSITPSQSMVTSSASIFRGSSNNTAVVAATR